MYTTYEWFLNRNDVPLLLNNHYIGMFFVRTCFRPGHTEVHCTLATAPPPRKPGLAGGPFAGDDKRNPTQQDHKAENTQQQCKKANSGTTVHRDLLIRLLNNHSTLRRGTSACFISRNSSHSEATFQQTLLVTVSPVFEPVSLHPSFTFPGSPTLRRSTRHKNSDWPERQRCQSSLNNTELFFKL